MALAIRPASAIRLHLRDLYLVKGVLPAKSVGQLVGESNAGKTAVALDMALRVSLGLDWGGRKAWQTPVLYVALENPASVERRIVGWAKRNRVPLSALSNLHRADGTLDLRSQADVEALMAGAQAINAGLVVIDTQSFAVGDADENSAKDMNLVFSNLSRIRSAADCTILVVHHTARRQNGRKVEGRGSNSQTAAADVLLAVDGKKISISKSRDGEKESTWAYSLSGVVIGTDADNDDVTTVVADVVPCATPVRQQTAHETPSSARLSGDRALFLSVLTSLQASAGVVSEDELRRAFYNATSERNADASRRAFGRAKASAVASGLVTSEDGLLTLKAADPLCCPGSALELLNNAGVGHGTCGTNVPACSVSRDIEAGQTHPL